MIIPAIDNYPEVPTPTWKKVAWILAALLIILLLWRLAGVGSSSASLKPGLWPVVNLTTIPDAVQPILAPPILKPKQRQARSFAHPAAPAAAWPHSLAPPNQEGMHRELIPKNITIVRCYYDEELSGPGMTFGFDLNGSGFDEGFYRMIRVDPDALDVEIRDLRLITPNQIHGTIVVGPEARTQYVYPKVMIRNLPAFKAPAAFGVIRPGEALDILLTGIDETGQSGHFRILTNLDESTFKRLRIEPTTDKLDISNLTPQFSRLYVEGDLRIAQGLHRGQYGVIARLDGHEIYKKDPLFDVVRPDVGRTGSIDDIKAVEAAHRPGDLLELALLGSGFTPGDTAALRARIIGFDTAAAGFSYVSQGRLKITLPVPSNLPVGIYGITIRHGGTTLFQKKSVFVIVPPNWLAGVNLAQPLAPGQSGLAQIKGRDLSPGFTQSLRVDVDEPGLKLSPLRFQDSSTVVADVHVSTGVAPGDYLLNVTCHGKPVRLPTGSIIKIGS